MQEKLACLSTKLRDNLEYAVKYTVDLAEMKLISYAKQTEFLEFKCTDFQGIEKNGKDQSNVSEYKVFLIIIYCELDQDSFFSQ